MRRDARTPRLPPFFHKMSRWSLRAIDTFTLFSPDSRCNNATCSSSGRLSSPSFACNSVTLYKSKVIERMSRELREKLQDENLTDDEMQDIMQRLSNLNRGKVSIARKLHRLIL